MCQNEFACIWTMNTLTFGYHDANEKMMSLSDATHILSVKCHPSPQWGSSSMWYLPIGPGAPFPSEEAPPRTPLPLGRVVLITQLNDHVLVALVLLRGFLLEHLGHLFLWRWKYTRISLRAIPSFSFTNMNYKNPCIWNSLLSNNFMCIFLFEINKVKL